MANKKKAIITGVTGQDGYYLSKLLTENMYDVHGMVRASSFENVKRIEQLKSMGVTIHYGDMTDSHSIRSLIDKIRPTEIYNLAAQSHVGKSFKIPETTGEIDGLGVLRILQAIKDIDPSIRFYQASTSELYGKVSEVPQTEETPLRPRSPYAVAKLYAYWTVRLYREAYGIFACNGILFNHESPIRGEDFVTKKIVTQMCQITRRERDIIELGNLDAKRDWGFAGDYVEAMYLMLQKDKPDDYVIATNETHTVREFVEETARSLGFEIAWDGVGVDQIGTNRNTGEVIIKINPEFYRPAEVDILQGDPSKARRILGWEPKTKFKDLIKIMVDEEMNAQNTER